MLGSRVDTDPLGNAMNSEAQLAGNASTKPDHGSVRGQPGYFTRLLFANESRPTTSSSQSRAAASPRFLKVRVLTWNMHDTIPKGNLEDLLGAVPEYIPVPDSEPDKLRIPNLSLDDEHPYHIVIVAGQECPTVSGIPRGIAAGFKLKEKHKDPVYNKSNGDKVKSKDNDEKQGQSDPVEPHDSNVERIASSSAVDLLASDSHGHGPTSGWSWILENWYCRGMGHASNHPSHRPGYERDPNKSEIEQPQKDHLRAEVAKNVKKFRERKNSRHSICIKKTGPYELLIKERLMGIYMAVFVYRDLLPLVEGISKSAVTSGLIGGRVGNKGGVGVSFKIAGTTFLLINAHLAAHEDKIKDRLSNIAKIKAELQVDDFLNSNDPRQMAEDLTDRFDYTFVFGDLNFRLDITRLHADWLIPHQQYKQALAFDQLCNLMKKGEEFVGFKEGEIDFPPTFKYDVMRTLKRDKSHAGKESGKSRERRMSSRLSNYEIPEIEENQASGSHTIDMPNETCAYEANKPSTPFSDLDDTASLRSTSKSSVASSSRPTSAIITSDDYFSRPRTRERSSSVVDQAAERLFGAKVAIKAKTKWTAFARAASPRHLMFHKRKVRRKVKEDSGHVADNMASNRPMFPGSLEACDQEIQDFVQVNAQSMPDLHPELSKSTSAISSKSLNLGSLPLTNDSSVSSKLEEGKGVYDSSSKQRVPSWCDRILFKSTVKPDPEPEEEVPENRPGIGPRMMNLISQVFRPRTSRNRSSSQGSLALAPSDPVNASPITMELSLTAEPEPSSTANNLASPATPSSSEQHGLLSGPGFPGRSPDRSSRHRHKFLFNNAGRTRLKKFKTVDVTLSEKSSASSPARTRSFSFDIIPPHPRPRPGLKTHTHPIHVPNSDPGPVPRRIISGRTSSLLSLSAISKPRSVSSSSILRPPRRVFSFFTRSSSSSANHLESRVSNQGAPQLPDPLAELESKPRKGDVVTLGYKSLDDQAMYRLRGRSDHRPVIGSYAIYL